MTGETPYKYFSDYELDELCDRWMIYYSWWNISLKREDMYVRKIYGKETIVVYPNSCFKAEIILGDYGIHIPEDVDPSHIKSILSSWLRVYNEKDLNTLINRYRIVLENIVLRINPDYITTVSTIMSRIRNFLMFYLVGED